MRGEVGRAAGADGPAHDVDVLAGAAAFE
jgi:hypothetical protein